MGATNEIAIIPTLYKSLPSDPTTTFAPVAPVAEFPNILVVRANLPAQTLPELISLVPSPGARIIGRSRKRNSKWH
jgi:tripartite-type tricarboxylate transporter receptor subunit TctC